MYIYTHIHIHIYSYSYLAQIPHPAARFPHAGPEPAKKKNTKFEFYIIKKS